MMETDNHEFVVASDSAVPDTEKLVESSSKHPASEPVGASGDGDDVEEIGSDDDDEEDEEEDDGEISLEEDLDEEEEVDADEEDEEMQDQDGADEDITMQSIESNGHANHPVAQTS